MTSFRSLVIAVWSAVVLCLASLTATAADFPCPAYSAPIRVNFVTHAPPVTYNNEKNVTGIRDIFVGRGIAMAGPHIQALGVTFTSPLFSIEGHTRIESHNGGMCVYLVEVDVDFGFRSMDVYVASEYPPGTCEYRTILDHENQHVSLNNEALHQQAPQVRAELERLLADEQPMYVMDATTATHQILAALVQRMQPVIGAFEQDLSQRNHSIDTAQNYKATSAVCANWDRGNVWPQVKAAGAPPPSPTQQR